MRTLGIQSIVGVAALVVLILAVEVGCRLAGYDFSHTQRVWDATPVYYRRPSTPLGEVFFRRSGPQQWTGRPLFDRFNQVGLGVPNPYEDETDKTITYDRHGFRNPEELEDWEVVVTGDSFTELGHLESDHLFTTVLADRLGCRVKNLGTSYTGLLTQHCYLEHFGFGKSTRHVVVVFFDGNDVIDTVRETKQLAAFRKSGERPSRELSQYRQTSFLVALSSGVRRLRHLGDDRAFATATLGSERVRVTLAYTPRNEDELTLEQRREIESALDKLAEECDVRGVRLWLAYMPCKRRVLHGRVAFEDGVAREMIEWQPSDLPEYVRRLCEQRSVGFIDLVEPLTSDQLYHNTILDTHLNAQGSGVAGEVIAESLRGRF